MGDADFSGYATKAGLKCSDGRTITSDAFKHMDGQKIPLVWHHMKDDPKNVLGHGVLEARDDGMYVYGYFNDTENAVHSKRMLQHGDIESLSIYANQLVEKGKTVLHGLIHEVSLVLSGANPGAKIDYVAIAHSDGDTTTLDDEAVISMGLEAQLSHADGDESDENESDDDAPANAEEIFNTLNEEQMAVVTYMLGAALEANAGDSTSSGEATQSADTGDSSEETLTHKQDTTEDALTHQEGTDSMGHTRVFDNEQTTKGSSLSHDQLMTIVDSAKEMGSWKESLLKHAAEYGIDEIELLFPDAKNVTTRPEFVKRRTEWVNRVIAGTKHSPFSRIKSMFADITADEARAKGYIKGNLKKEEVFGLLKRTTTPTTIYKKQKLDRDDMLDITDFDVVQWLWTEMRLMLDEELAGAVLFGDGRDIDDPDHILDPRGESSGPGIRSIAHDDEFYAPRVYFDSTDSNWTPDDLMDTVVEALEDYEGSGTPTLFTTTRRMNQILLQKDSLGRRLYANRTEVAQLMGVGDIVDVPQSVMDRAEDVAGIIVNLNDYTLGTDAGGQISKFDDFDIDYNQYKYLLEGRSSGALTKYRSAVVLVDGVEPEPEPDPGP